MSSFPPNAYVAPASIVDPTPLVPEVDSGLETTRRISLSIEKQIRAIGVLCYMATFGYIGVYVAAIIPAIIKHEDFYLHPLQLIASAVGAGLIVAAGFNLRRIRKLGRTLYVAHFVYSIAMSVWSVAESATAGQKTEGITFWRLIIPFLISGYLFGKDGAVVFADFYQKSVLPQTQHIKAGTAWWGWLIPGLVLTGIGFAIAAGLLHRLFS